MRTSLEAGRSSSPDVLEKSAQIYMLDDKQIEHYWPHIEISLDAAPELWSKWFTKETLLHRAYQGRLQVWVICNEKDGPINTVFFSQVMNTDVINFLHIFWMWGQGSLGALKCAALAVGRFARHTGCEEVLVTGRPGWVRIFKDAFGAEFRSVTVAFPVPKQLREN